MVGQPPDHPSLSHRSVCQPILFASQFDTFQEGSSTGTTLTTTTTFDAFVAIIGENSMFIAQIIVTSDDRTQCIAVTITITTTSPDSNLGCVVRLLLSLLVIVVEA